MASPLDDVNKIIAALVSGASTKDVLKKYKMKPQQLVALLTSAPAGTSMLSKALESQYKIYEKYNPNVSYTTRIAGEVPATNPALDKYKQYPAKYSKLIQDYAISILRDPVAGDQAFNQMAGGNIAQQYGLTDSEYSSLLAQLAKDKDQIVSGEASRQAKEFAAFQKGRGAAFKKAGIQPTGPQGGTIRAAFGAATGSPELYDLIEKYRTATQMKTPDWLIQEGGMGAYYPRTKQLKPTKSQIKKAQGRYATGGIDLLKNILGRSL